MSRPLLSLRRQMISLQQRVVRQLRNEIFGAVTDISPELRSYQRTYERSFQSYRRIVERRTFLRAIRRADIVFQGDFHTLRECQRTTARLLDELLPERNVVLALEMVTREHQPSLDAYLVGEIDEEQFLRAIDYESNWGFDWNNYRPLFELARSHELQVYGINFAPRDGENSLHRRDLAAAESVIRATLAHPDSLVYVVVGDFHVCRAHLPAEVERQLALEGASRRMVLIHQNVDSFYWQLAEKRQEHHAEVLEVGPGEFCLMNSTPMAKYQSYLHWELGQDELLEGAASGGEAAQPIAEEVHHMVHTITRFLGVESDGMDDFTVYTASDFDFLENLGRDAGFSARELREIKRQVMNQESYFIPAVNIIYLATLSVDHAAEEASHYINSKLAGYLLASLPPRTDFYYRTIKEALGFFGSKIINPLRFHHDERELRQIHARSLDGQADDPALQSLFTIARYALQHLDGERRFRRTGRRPSFRKIYQQDVDTHLGITHTLGYILGNKLYGGLLAGDLRRSAVRRLFERQLDGEGEAEDLYFELVVALK